MMKTMTNDYNDGQIWGWNGGECPVHPETVVEVWFRCKDSDIWPAGGLEWKHTCEYDDIIAFKVVKQHVEPKVIWVNEYEGFRQWAAYPDEQEAKNGAGTAATRIAVKYVEVKE
jgi:hypothetical protein